MSEEAVVTQPLNFSQELQALVEALPGWLPNIGAAAANAFEAGDASWPLVFALMLTIGVVGERLVCWRLNKLNRIITEQRSDSWVVILGYAVFRVVFDLAGVLLFGFFAWVALYLSVANTLPVYHTLAGLLVGVMTFRAWLVVVRAILAPQSEGIRPLALSNDDSRVFYRWVMLIVGVYVSIAFLFEYVVVSEMTPVLARATIPLGGLVVNLIINVFVWKNRTRITRLFASARAPQAPPSVLRQIVAQSWPFLVTAWLLTMWASWAHAVFTGNVAREHSTLISWWITLLFPMGDRLLNALLNKLANLRWLSDTGFEARRERFVSVVQTCLRLTLLAVAVAALAVTWNIAGTSMLGSQWGQRIIWAAVDIGITVLVAYVLYELVMSMLEKHMPEEPEDPADVDGEIGGTGATRQETLAPLLRGVFIVLLVVTVVLTVLTSLGVQILPLIAGASIIGLAIGFGSQRLVQDVISGVFFLVDDAFRRGEYIDVGSVKGTVEKISVRSLQLRHHMGALHTIPFGEIRHLTNYSRDWVMMKLKFRLTYDTDVEKVRKLVKRLGVELMEDEEVGPLFLQPLKSQGVYSMEDDSAMIMRVKFMTRPGDQFVVRKTVYARLRELFEREGIEFAHRVVSVRLDGASPEDLDDEQKRRVAGAALSATAEASD